MKAIILSMFFLQRQLSPICDNITAGVAYDCDNPPAGGANDRLILINFEDWQNAAITLDPANKIVITGITLPSGKVGYVYEGKNNSVEPSANFVKGTYVNSYDHTVLFKIFQNSPDIKKQLLKLDGGKVVAITQNNHKGLDGNSAFEVFGSETGLELAELARVIADAELQGAYNLTIKNNEKSRPSTLPHTIWDTDFATTKAIVDALI